MRAGSDDSDPLRTLEREWNDEYTYCHDIKPGMSHEAYLNESGATILWMREIHRLRLEDQAARERESQRGR